MPGDVADDLVESLCEAAIKDKVHEVEELLVEKNVPVDSQSQKSDRTALMLGTAWNCYNTVQLLLRRGANPNFQDPDCFTSLHLAAENNSSLKIFNMLIQAGANVDAQDSDGYTPLHIAAGEGHLRLVKALLKAGAEPSIFTTTLAKTAFDIALEERHADIAFVLQEWKASPKWTEMQEHLDRQLSYIDSMDDNTFSTDESTSSNAELWNADDVADIFLKKLKLGQYAPAFIDNRVDGHKLLTIMYDDASLENLVGVTNSVHRLRIKKAISDLRRKRPLKAPAKTEEVVESNKSPKKSSKKKSSNDVQFDLQYLNANSAREHMLAHKSSEPL